MYIFGICKRLHCKSVILLPWDIVDDLISFGTGVLLLNFIGELSSPRLNVTLFVLWGDVDPSPWIGELNLNSYKKWLIFIYYIYIKYSTEKKRVDLILSYRLQMYQNIR